MPFKQVTKWIKHFVYMGLAFIYSCSQTTSSKRFNISTDSLFTNFTSWWNYNYRNINLTQPYTPLDTASNQISKAAFLQYLSSGNYVALKLVTVDSSSKYQLYRIPTGANKEISLQVKQLGKVGYARYKMEGTTIPDFDFVDLNGHIYNRETTKGKVVIIKCWFIHCLVCIEEMPVLNEIVKQYRNRNDIVFVSLAFDSKEELQTFLLKKKFEYAVVPVKQAYLENQLGVIEYPTQFIINRNGNIVKVVTNYSDMVSVLKHELSQL